MLEHNQSTEAWNHNSTSKKTGNICQIWTVSFFLRHILATLAGDLQRRISVFKSNPAFTWRRTYFQTMSSNIIYIRNIRENLCNILFLICVFFISFFRRSKLTLYLYSCGGNCYNGSYWHYNLPWKCKNFEKNSIRIEYTNRFYEVQDNTEKHVYKYHTMMSDNSQTDEKCLHNLKMKPMLFKEEKSFYLCR